MRGVSLWVLALLVVLSVDISTQDEVPLDCQQGWTLMGVQCYKLYQGILPWESASKVCQSYGGELAKVTDFMENQDVGMFAVKQSIMKYWIGFTRTEAPAGNQEIGYWTDGEETSIAAGFWENGEPNEDDGKCVYVMEKNARYFWTLGPCESKMPYVCQRPACPAGSYHCVNGRCVNKGLVCDGEDDCGDSSDEMDCASHCTYHLISQSGSITSPNYPNNYNDSMNCRWTIQLPLGQNAYLKFTNFTTESDNDVIQVLVGGLTETHAMIVGSHSGDLTTRLPDYTSYNNFIIVKFSTDSAANALGFRAEFSGRSANLQPVQYLAAADRTAVHVSPGYPLVYLGGQDYTWIIRTTLQKQIITLNIQDVNLRGEDTFLVRDGSTVKDNLLYKFEEDTRISDIPYILSTGNSIYLTMKTRGFKVGRGFRITYRQGCDVTLIGIKGHIFSPGFPLTSELKGSNYPNQLDCIYRVDIRSNPMLTLRYLTLETQAVKDVVTVNYGGANPDVMSGSTSLVQRRTTGKFNVTFKTDAIIGMKGFSFMYSIDCPDPNFNDKTILTPSSPTWQYGSVFIVTCQPGYRFSSQEYKDVTKSASGFVSYTSVRMECMSNGRWNVRTTPNCYPMYCGPAPLVDNAYVNSSLGQASSVGGSVTYECYPGFTMTGSASVACRNDGTWGPTPTCAIASCPQLVSTISFGSVNKTHGDGTEFGSIVTFSCNQGYQIVGSPILFCTSSSTWSSGVPSCTRKNCPDPPILYGKFNDQTMAFYGDTRAVMCDQGFQLTGGTNPITCGADQTFSNLANMRCADRNECSVSGTCAQNCRNTVGSYKCSCEAGYTLNADGRTCDDVLECSTPNKAGCSQNCVEKAGSYECTCNQGYELFTANGQLNYTIPATETGTGKNDIYRLQHTCIRIQCVDPPALANGYILTKRKYHRYMDRIIMACAIGYELTGLAVRECQASGQWSGFAPRCTPATCPAESVPGNLKTTPTVMPSGSVNFMSFLNITCNVPGRPSFVKQRQCLLDPVTKSYRFYGAQYECGVIDCGDPSGVPGAIIPAGLSTTFNSNFTFQCRNLYTKEGTSALGNDLVSCKSNGYWGWGTLRCIGLTCTDPGHPVDGTQHATTYEEGAKVNYTCDRPGYTIQGNSVLTCVLSGSGTSLAWDHAVPTCADTTAPVFSNCVNVNTVSRFTTASNAVPVPSVTDNTGVKSLKVTTPIWPSDSFVIREPTLFTFEAEDFNGNKATCNIQVNIKDEIPPRVICPGPKTILLSDPNDFSYTVFDATSQGVVATDNSGVTPTFIFAPQSVNLTASAIGQANYKEWIYVTARDTAGNEDQCRFQIVVQAAVCSPMALPTPVHGQKNCVANGNVGYTCNLTCDARYMFRDQAPETVITTSCLNDNPFNLASAVPACSFSLPESPVYTQVLNVTYNTDNSAAFNTQICPSATASSVNAVADQLEQVLPRHCQTLQTVPTITFKPVTDADIIYDPSTSTVTVIYRLQYTQAVTSILTSCANVMYGILRDPNFDDSKTLAGHSSEIRPISCPGLNSTEGFAKQMSQDFSCSSGLRLVNTFCLKCPKGTYVTQGNTCTPCPVGKFNDVEGASSCKDCPANTWTYTVGAADSTTCKAQCDSGSTSNTRLPPCLACPLSTFWINSTYCQPCPQGSITRDTGANLSSECKALCEPGTYNERDGYESCKQCPVNFYQDQRGQTTCKECSTTNITVNVGSKSVTDCIAGTGICSGVCQNGNCNTIRHAPSCICPDGFSGEKCEIQRDPCASSPCNNGGSCVASGASFSCNCPAGTTGDRCEVDIDNCPSPLTPANNPCQNGGMCQDKLNTYNCLCKDGFTGSLCSSPQPICTAQPCINGACNPIGTFRRECNCSQGYTGKSCEININECDENPCLHGGACTDLVNGYSCKCRPGYSGNECQIRLNKCSGVTCGNRGMCVEDFLHDTYRCVCNPDSSYGQYCDYIPYVNRKLTTLTFSQNVTGPPSPTRESCKQACDNQGPSCGAFSYITNGSSIQCLLHGTRSGQLPLEAQQGATYYVKKCSYVRDDFFTDWLDAANPSSTGNYFSLSYLRDTLKLDICGGTEPLAIECRDATTKGLTSNSNTACSLSVGFACANSDQPGATTCNKHEVRFKCAVSRVFKENTCFIQPYCDSSPCVNGACRADGVSFVCDCNQGYSGSLCQNNIDDCATSPCQNGGTCTDGVNTFSCQCANGYEGPTCGSRVNYCSSMTCDINGSINCTNTLEGALCFCRPGYTNPTCSQNIQECNSNPCLHNGDCTDAINDFVCTCKPGWTGKRCEILVTPCNPVSPCENNAVCHNLFGDFFCRCNANTFGKTCGTAPSVCSSANPCVRGICSENSGVTSCYCGQNYTGPGCEIQVDHCNSHTCQNKAECIVPSLDNYQCSCPAGYSGTNCETNNNDCASVSCPGDGTCIDGVNEYFCRCPVGKDGVNCDRVLDRNYDLLFELSQKTSQAYLPYPIRLNTTKLSVTLWVRYWSKDGTGTFLTMYTVDGPNSLAGKKEFIRIDHTGLTISIDGSPLFVPPNKVKYNDGRWYQITVTWNGETGLLRFVVNTISNTIKNYQTGKTLDNYTWIVLGSRYNPVTDMPIMYEGFNGWLSQLSIYDVDLTFTQQIPLKLEEPRRIFSNEIFAWNGFRRSSGVSIVIPSTASRISCPRGYSGPSCNTPNERKLVVYPLEGTCPTDIIKLGPTRITRVTWTTPTFGGSPSTVISTYKSGDVFGWGRHLVVYVASNTAGNKGLCSFKIFVQFSNCTQPANPYKGIAQESRASYPLITNRIQCDAGYESVRPVPRLYTCPRIGHYNPPRKYNTFKFPPCGKVVQDPRRKVFVQLFYQAVTTFCPGIKTVMETEIRNSIKILNNIWGKGLCSLDDCSDVTIIVGCGSAGRRKRQTVLDAVANITLPRAKSTVSNGSVTLTPEDVLQLSILSGSRFNFEEAIPNAVPLDDLLQLSSSLACAEGQAVVGGKCVKCAIGTFYNSGTSTCDLCPIGQYQSAEGATSCLSCGVKTTELPGATSVIDCKDNCTAGQKFDDASNRCVECPIGFYQHLTGQFFCYPCSVENTTRSTGSTSVTQCYAGCGKGEQLGALGTCEKCPVGKYRHASMSKCEDCPPGLTTLTTGADDESLCNVGDCQAGYFRNNIDPRQCEICPKGTYQDLKQQYVCKSCGNSPYFVTLTAGSTSRSDCRFVCPDGQEEATVQSPRVCTPCKVGFFRNKTTAPEGKCSSCFPGTSTPSTGAVNIDECSVLQCLVGQQPNANNTGCELCPLGTYQDSANQPACTQCLGQTSTRSIGSNRSAQCESYCVGGQEKLADGSCQLCPVGFYKENSDFKFMACTRCPDQNTVTESTGADSAAKCTVRNCQPGYKRTADDSDCEACQVGYFQPLPYQKNCMQCPLQTSTRQNATAESSKCERYCNNGLEKDASGLCQPCKRGFYKNNVDGLFEDCQMCPPAYITSSTGATSQSDCTIFNCSAGYKTESSGCVICPVGYYQENKWQPDCDKCPTDKTTVSPGSTAASDCILSCPPGKEDVGGTCSPCKRGYHKDIEKAAPCTECPTNTTTTSEGSTSVNDCNIVGCPPGYQSISTTQCQQCGYGFYQPDRWQSDCESCDNGQTTFIRGATSKSDCVLDCPVGQQYNSATGVCDPCPQGYYQDKRNPQFPMCIICGDPERITPGTGATSAADCTVQNCTTPGQFLNSTINRCQGCPVGTYQDTKWQTSCKSCLPGFTTRTTNSPRSSSCVRDCPLGKKQVGDSCVDCGYGYYRDGSTWDCIQCPDNLGTTSLNAASLGECNISPCTAGQFFDRPQGRCLSCPLNTYQTRSSMFECDSCPSGKFTTTVGSQDPADCKGFCDTGSRCSPNAICTDDPKTRYNCTCKSDYVGNGVNCTHKCDTSDYCKSGGACYRGPPAYCQCTEFYKGDQCEIRRAAEQVSDQNTLTIVGIVIGVMGFLLLLILIAACLYRRRRSPTAKRTPSEYDDRTSLARGPYDYPLAYVPSKAASVVSAPHYMLPQNTEKSYDNQLYTDDPAVYKA